MKIFEVILVLFMMGFCTEAQSAWDLCKSYNDVFNAEIGPKIKMGIPFELMSILSEDGILLYKKTVRVSFNPWDEEVVLKQGEKVIAKFQFKDGLSHLCKFLDFQEERKSGSKYFYRLLLNPMWGERIARLRISAGGGADDKRMIGVDWKGLSEQIPNDKVLIEMGIQ